MLAYKYFINIDWIPINEIESSRYNVIKSSIRRPEIVSCLPDFGGKVYEVSDPFLFYCETESKYEYLVYKFKNMRIVKYRAIGDTTFKLCIKSSDLDLGLLNKLVSYSNSTAAVVKQYNVYNLYEFKKPIYVEREHPYISDIVSHDGILMISLAETNSFISVGYSTQSIRAKATVHLDISRPSDIHISLFDIYKIDGSVLRIDFESRHAHLNSIISSLTVSANVKITIAKLLSNPSADTIQEIRTYTHK